MELVFDTPKQAGFVLIRLHLVGVIRLKLRLDFGWGVHAGHYFALHRFQSITTCV